MGKINVNKQLIRAVVAEFVATALFVFIGCGSALAQRMVSQSSILSISFGFGLAIAVLVYSVAHYSGGHINPIVTMAMVLLGQLNAVAGVFYIVAQLTGSILGAGLLHGTTRPFFKDLSGDVNPIDLVINKVNGEGNEGAAFLMEMILSFLLVFVILETALNKKSGAGNNAPLAIGLAVFLAHIVSIPFTGTSINPARSFGPAIVSGKFDDLWLFFLGPIFGGLLATGLGIFVFDVTADDSTNIEEQDFDLQTPLLQPATLYKKEKIIEA